MTQQKALNAPKMSVRVSIYGAYTYICYHMRARVFKRVFVCIISYNIFLAALAAQKIMPRHKSQRFSWPKTLTTMAMRS